MNKRKKIIGSVAAAALFCIVGIFLWKKMNSDQPKEQKEFSAFFAVQDAEMDADNRIQNLIMEKTGAKANCKWLAGQTAEEYVRTVLANGKLPDFIEGATATSLLVENHVLVALDDYIDRYPNIKKYLSEEEWDSLRQSDGHIYFIPQFSVINGESREVRHIDEAFWIQKRVLEWGGYPQIKTINEYFKLIKDYLKANPTTDGQKNTGFEILCDDWRYFCLENPIQFLLGYPNDGCAIVDPKTKKVKDYDVLPETETYYQILCQAYNDKVIDPETFTASFDEYCEKIAGGNVLGMVDQYWQFMTADNILYENGQSDRTYIGLPLVLEEGISPNYRTDTGLNISDGLAITTSCEDIEGALQFMNDLLDPEIEKLRYWGEEGVDYEVDENGLYYLTEEQRKNRENSAWGRKNLCTYDYFPHYSGTMQDDKNAVNWREQLSVFKAGLTDYDRKFLEAYGYDSFIDFMGESKKKSAWYPLYTVRNSWTSNSEEGKTDQAMSEVKKTWLPKVIMSSTKDFSKTWKNYMNAYHKKVNVSLYENILEEEVKKRIK